ncbi:RNA-directed DNA polymerase, eukaryota, reverse transcriptase zinc-binding domain protein [Tanacetum coccineum]
MGDFNKVRAPKERFGSIFNKQGAEVFNYFIALKGLVDVPMVGCSFTWVHKSASKMSKLDRFLISEDKGDFNPPILNKPENIIKDLQNLDRVEASELAQKSKTKWVIEGDKNSKYFHGILNKKQSQLTVRGILVEGIWIVKNEFFMHFQNGFDHPGPSRLILDMNFPNILSEDQRDDMERPVSKDEIKKAIWDCGLDKSPGPDGFTFGFYRRPISLIGSLYKIIAKILANRLVGVLSELVDEVQSAFVANRQILDGPFILNELIQWCKSKKRQTMVFKVDFEKAFDSVRWDYLHDILRKFSFGDRWCRWIQSCLSSFRGSILVNGSPTNEFQFHKGLKQGDLISPFLFILIMETLHLSFQNVVNEGMFKGVSIGSSLNLSHLFYADDVVLIGQWSDSNIKIIVQVLECFFRASGLRINIQKSKLIGIAVEEDKVLQVAHSIGCLTFTTAFSYLGVKVGGMMSRTQAWDDIINKLTTRLSKWKMKTLSIEGHLTLTKLVLGSTPIYYMSMFKAPLQRNVLASKDKGGLGVSSFFALNRALMFKWVWRFRNDNNSLWASIIKALHGENGSIGTPSKNTSIWLDIVRDLDKLKNQGINLLIFITKRVGNGENTLFWKDVRKGDMPFMSLYPRVFALESNKNITVAHKLSQEDVGRSFRRCPRGGVEFDQFSNLLENLEVVTLPDMHDRWVWSLMGSGEFTVASVRRYLDDHTLPDVSSKTRWLKAVPIKVNVHAWKVKLDSLPTRFNLYRRGLDIPSILCPICGKAAETTSHIFFSCSMARDIYRKISTWWDIILVKVSSFEEWSVWLSSIRLQGLRLEVLEGVFFIIWWLVWNFRNKLIFGVSSPLMATLFDDVVARSFSWCRYRCKLNISRSDWVKNPSLSIL